ncbi:MAG: M13 family metallopeptidase, partial [Acidobacteria bacterium]|nr:M13 family metallopeptidase [Acidobacteriota bacterium]
MRIFSPILFLALATPLCVAQAVSTPTDNGPSAAPKKPISFDVSAIDTTADPCTNFYQYACGNWKKDNPIPADQTRWGRFNELSERNNYLLYTELKAAAANPKSAAQKQYGDFFAACMNTEVVDKLGAKPLEPELDAIAALTSTKDLAAFNAKEAKRGLDGFFNVQVTQDQKDSSQQIAATGQGGLTLPDRDYYLNQDARYVKIRQQYVENMTKTFELLGDTDDKAASEANDVLRIETALAKGSMDRVAMRDPANRYHVMSVADLQKMTPDYDWSVYLDGIGMQQVKTIDVMSPGYDATANELLSKEPLQSIKSYLRWRAVHEAAPLLSKPFEDANFDFFMQTLQGQKEEQPRWKRCTRLTDQALGESVGQEWVKQNFPPEAKANMEKLVHALEASMAADLKTLPWMSEATKQQALLKLNAITDKIGYPEHWRDYSSVVVKRDELLDNVEHADNFERKRNLDKFGKPVDPSEWMMTPPTVNAYYNPPQNNINFPAGILQPPFYDDSKDPAVNFGGIGVVIGHEMTHGFDDQGSKY